MEPLKCTYCGAQLTTDQDGVVCEYCGMRYKEDVVKKMIALVQAGEARSLEKRLENGNTFLNLGDYEKAEDAFHKVIKEYPEDYRGWWGLLMVETHCLQSLDANYHDNYYENACKLAPEEKKQQQQEKYNHYLQQRENQEKQLQRQAHTKALYEQKQDREKADQVKRKWYVCTAIALIIFVFACSVCLTGYDAKYAMVPAIILSVYNYIAPIVVRQYSEIAAKELRIIGFGYNLIPLIIHTAFLSSMRYIGPMVGFGYSLALIGVATLISCPGFLSKKQG